MDYFVSDYRVGEPVAGESVVLEDTIMQKGRPAAAGSKILENFISPFDATVVSRIEAVGMTILRKANMDEFGVAGLFPDAVSKGSGAVSAVADGVAAAALCNDYSGTIRRQAAALGLCYIHPTYGTVSRFGLIPAAPSMDQIGVVCRDPQEGFRILSVIAGNDLNDGAMLPPSQSQAQPTGKITIGVPANVFAQASDAAAAAEFAKSFDRVELELEYFGVFAQVMQILCCAEISSNICRYDGIKFGYRAEGYRDLRELYTKSRSEALGRDAKLAIVAGAMVLSQGNYENYYDKAMRVRRLIKQSLEFGKYDAILMPVSGAGPLDGLALNALPQLCGLPSVTVPIGGGLTLIAEARREDVLLSALNTAQV